MESIDMNSYTTNVNFKFAKLKLLDDNVKCCICLTDKNFCICKEKLDYNKPLSPFMPLVLTRTLACVPNCSGNCSSCQTNKKVWIEECENKGYIICTECLYSIKGCICKGPVNKDNELINKTETDFCWTPQPPRAGSKIKFDFPHESK